MGFEEYATFVTVICSENVKQYIMAVARFMTIANDPLELGV
jgi:hypothetical protein